MHAFARIRVRSVAGFPYVAVYLPKSRTSFQRVYFHEGMISGPDLLRAVTEAMVPAMVHRDMIQAEAAARMVPSFPPH